MTNKNKTTLYVGVTSNLPARLWDHVNRSDPKSFTARYNLDHCIYFEFLPTIEEAILREKEVKKWRREKKELLIASLNPDWNNLYNEIKEW